MQKKYIQVRQGTNLKRYTNTLNSLVVRSVKNQYRNSVLGILWTLLDPLLNMVIIALVFSLLFNRSTMPVNGVEMFYPLYILAGNTVFGLLRTSTTMSLGCIVGNYELLSKTRIPHEVFPLANLLSAVVNFFFSIIAIIIIMLIFISKPGVSFNWTMLMIPVPFLPALMLFCLGISFILATIFIRFRDIKHIYGVFLTLWTYLTPLFYSFDIISKHKTAVRLLQINPMYHFVTYFRQLLLGIIPSLTCNLICYAWGIGMFAIGFIIFHFSKKKFLLYI